jgi:hypothetical protein
MNTTINQLHHRLGVSRLVMAGLTALVILGICACSKPEGEPQASLSEYSHDFGKVSEKQELTHTFVVENTGKGTLVINAVEPDCACTVPKYDKKIQPGSKGEITLTIKPYSVIHNFQKDTKVRINDRKQSEIVLALKGNADPVIDIQPSHIIRFQGNPGQEVQIPIRITSHLPDPLKISYYQSSIPDKINVAIKPEEPGKIYVMTVTNKQKESGSYVGKIEIFTNNKEHARLLFRVFGDFPPPAVSKSDKTGLPKEQGVSKQ